MTTQIDRLNKAAALLNITTDKLLENIEYMVKVQLKGYEWFPKKKEVEEIPECVKAEMEVLGLTTLEQYKAHHAAKKAEKEAQRKAELEAEKAEVVTDKPSTLAPIFGSVEEEKVEIQAEEVITTVTFTEEQKAELDAQVEAVKRKNEEAKVKFAKFYETEEEVQAKKEEAKKKAQLESLGSDPIKAIELVLAEKSGSPRKTKLAQWFEVFGSDIKNFITTIPYMYENQSHNGKTTEKLQTAYQEFKDVDGYVEIVKPEKELSATQAYHRDGAKERKEVTASIGTYKAQDLLKAVQGDDEVLDLTKPMFDLTAPDVKVLTPEQELKELTDREIAGYSLTLGQLERREELENQLLPKVEINYTPSVLTSTIAENEDGTLAVSFEW